MRLLTEHMEFTWDMIRTLPKLYYYLNQGEEVEVHCKANLEELYRLFTPHVTVQGHPAIQAPGTYSHTPPSFVEESWTPPPLKDMFKDKLKFENNKPIVTIHNKYTNEWNFRRPVIYLSLEFLDEVFKVLTPHFNVVYIRPSLYMNGYSFDGQAIHELGELEMIKEKYPAVLTIQDIMQVRKDLDYNKAQFTLLASSDKHIAVAGGNACISAYFGGELLIYNCPDCPSHNRRIWDTGSWLELLGNSKIVGYQNYDSILEHINTNWVN